MDKQIQFQQAAAMILGFEQNLPQSLKIPTSYVAKYHDNVDKIQVATGLDLGHFRIPEDELIPVTKTRSESIGRDRLGVSRGTRFIAVPTGSYYCPRSMFLIHLKGLVNFLQMQLAPKERAKIIGFS